jgi:hypothetical protein
MKKIYVYAMLSIIVLMSIYIYSKGNRTSEGLENPTSTTDPIQDSTSISESLTSKCGNIPTTCSMSGGQSMAGEFGMIDYNPNNKNLVIRGPQPLNCNSGNTSNSMTDFKNILNNLIPFFTNGQMQGLDSFTNMQIIIIMDPAGAELNDVSTEICHYFGDAIASDAVKTVSGTTTASQSPIWSHTQGPLEVIWWPNDGDNTTNCDNISSPQSQNLPGLLSHVNNVLINNNNTLVYEHCHESTDRSGVFAMSYWLKYGCLWMQSNGMSQLSQYRKQKMSLDDTLMLEMASTTCQPNGEIPTDYCSGDCPYNSMASRPCQIGQMIPNENIQFIKGWCNCINKDLTMCNVTSGFGDTKSCFPSGIDIWESPGKLKELQNCGSDCGGCADEQGVSIFSRNFTSSSPTCNLSPELCGNTSDSTQNDISDPTNTKKICACKSCKCT